jgi:hypothetical protein
MGAPFLAELASSFTMADGSGLETIAEIVGLRG